MFNQVKLKVVGFNISAAIDLEPHLGKYVIDLAQSAGGRVQPPRAWRATGQTYVHLVCSSCTTQSPLLELLSLDLVSCLQSSLELVCATTIRRSLLARERDHGLHCLCDPSPAAQIGRPPRTEPALILYGAQRLFSLPLYSFKCVKHLTSV